jgi:hypothetical protein
MDIKDILAIKKLDTRWCCIFKNYPQVVMTEKQCWMLSAGMAEGEDLETIQKGRGKKK